MNPRLLSDESPQDRYAKVSDEELGRLVLHAEYQACTGDDPVSRRIAEDSRDEYDRRGLIDVP